MIYRHTKKQVDDYYESLGLNQSSLKTILIDGIEKFIVMRDVLQRTNDDLYYEEKKHFVIGSAVDAHLSYGEEVYKSMYHVSQLVKKPGDKSMSVIRLAYDKAKEKFPLGPDVNMKLFAQEIYEAANEEGYYAKRMKPTVEEDTRIETILKEGGGSYWTELCLAEGKQILADDELTTINALIMSLTTHVHTKHLFEDAEDTDIVFQFPMFWTYKDVDCKGLVDLIIINHRLKKIYLIDIKTIGDYVTKFNKAIKRRRYDFQGAYYNFGITQCKTSLASLVGKAEVVHYEIANFAFIAESTIKPGCPLIFPMSTELLEQGRHGNEDKTVLGWEQALDIYKNWESLDFSLEKGFEETKGVLFIDRFYEYSNLANSIGS